MGFDLLTNPFAVLGLAGNSPVGAISSRARELGTGEASAASRVLLLPKTRLMAELSFLPGTVQADVDGCLQALKEGRQPDLWSLTPIARANVLAHLASSKRAGPKQLRDLVEMRESALGTAMEAVNRGRQESRIPPAPPEMADGALQGLATQHAEAMVDGLLALGNGGKLLSDLLSEAGDATTSKGVFLRQCTAGWERTKAGDLSRIIESAEPLEGTLREDPRPETARKLAETVRQFADATMPQRRAAHLLGLPHEASLEARGRWQSVALDLNNRLDAISEAVILLEALADAFDDQDDLQTRITKNLLVCRERVASGEGTPQIRRLTRAIKAASDSPVETDQGGLVDGRKTPACSAVAAELHDSFVAAAESATSDLPWVMLRSLTLSLHNEHKATSAAWSLTILAIEEARRNKAGQAMLPLLLNDRTSLRSQGLQRDLETAIRSKQKSTMRRILAELISLAEAPADKATYARLLWKLRSEAFFSYCKWGFWAAVAGVMAIAFLDQPPAPSRTASAPALQRPAPSPSTAPYQASGVAAPAMDRTVTQPPPGNAPLTISGLRWCRYSQVKAEAAKAHIEVLRLDPNLRIDRFNAAVDLYNAFLLDLNTSCGNYTYRRSDAPIVDAEVNEQRAALASIGRNAIESTYRVPVSPGPASTPTYTPPAAYVPPAAAAPPPSAYRPTPPAPAASRPGLATPAPANASFVDGQNDRRAWEVWMAGLSGPGRDGAEWWAGVRSTQRPPTCRSVPGGSDPVAAAAGCDQAKIRLANSDRRRRAEPEYRAGWNNP